MLDSDLVGHLSALVRGYSPREWSAQHVATLANAWAKAEVKDEALWAHWSASILHMNRSDLDLQVASALCVVPSQTFGADAEGPPHEFASDDALASCRRRLPTSSTRWRRCT